MAGKSKSPLLGEILQALDNDNLNRLTVILKREGIEGKLMEEYIQPGLEVEQSPIHWAAKNGQSDYLFMLIASGVPINAEAVIMEKGQEVAKLTPLHLAVFFNKTECVKVLLKMNAQTDIDGHFGLIKGTAEDWVRRKVGSVGPEIAKMFNMAEAARDFGPNMMKMMLFTFVIAPVLSFLFFYAINYLKKDNK